MILFTEKFWLQKHKYLKNFNKLLIYGNKFKSAKIIFTNVNSYKQLKTIIINKLNK